MREKLDSGRKKGYDGYDKNWQEGYWFPDCTPENFINRIQQEVLELNDAIKHGSKEDVLKECADIANFAMFISDLTRDEK